MSSRNHRASLSLSPVHQLPPWRTQNEFYICRGLNWRGTTSHIRIPIPRIHHNAKRDRKKR